MSTQILQPGNDIVCMLRYKKQPEGGSRVSTTFRDYTDTGLLDWIRASVARSRYATGGLLLITGTCLLLGIAVFGLQIYGAFRACSLHLLTIPDISAILFNVSFVHGTKWASPWASLPVIGMGLIIAGAIIDRIFASPEHYAGMQELCESVWKGSAPLRELTEPYRKRIAWANSGGTLFDTVGGFRLYDKGILFRRKKAQLTIRGGKNLYPGDVWFAIDFWQRGHEPKNLWQAARKPSVEAALPELLEQLTQRVRELTRVWSPREPLQTPKDWVGSSGLALLPEQVRKIRGALLCCAGICSAILALGLAQVALAFNYNWIRWAPFGGLAGASVFAGFAFTILWNIQDLEAESAVRRALYLAFAAGVIAVSILLPSLYFLAHSLMMLTPLCTGHAT